MATTWDWSPVAQGLQGLIGNYVQQKQYDDLLQNLIGPGVGNPQPAPAQGLIGRLLHPQPQQQAQPASVAQAAPMQMNPEDMTGDPVQPQNNVGMRTAQPGGGVMEMFQRLMGGAGTPALAGGGGRGILPGDLPGGRDPANSPLGGGSPLGGIDPRMADLLRRLPPQIGMPLLLQQLTKGAPEPLKVGAGEHLVNPQTGRSIYDAPEKAAEPFTLAEGGQRYGPDGKLIVSNPKAPTQTQAQQDAIALSLEPGTPAFNQYIRERTLPKPASTNVTVNAGNSLASGIGSGGADILKASQAAASGAVDTISTGNQIRDALASGKVMAGPGTTALMWMRQLSGGNQETLNQTRTVIQGLAKYALAGRGQLKGQGQISDYEGKLLQKAAGGDIDNMSIGELKTLTDLNERVARASIAKHKQVIEKTGKAGIPPEYLSIYGVDEPPPYGSASGGAQIPTVSSPAEARKLPSGTHFKTPDGRELVVP